ncbi:MAG TPA: IclR family transcriptional regulator [Burkholderiaceae bacterium]|nr:IclR family transcriptional regulator [Burkholderiaceae bacterium]
MRQIVDKIGTILALYSFERPELGVTELSGELSWPKSTVSEILTSLARQGFLERTRRGRFRLGWRFFELNQVLLESTPLVRESRRAMQELVERHGESSHLMVLERHQAVIVEKVQASLAMQILMSRVGLRLPAHCSACGKLLLALSPPDELPILFDDVELKPFTPATIIDFDRLKTELATIREAGIAYDREEIVPGLTCVAAPIRNDEGKPIAGISVSIPSYRFAGGEQTYVDMVRGAALRVSRSLGYIET